jgi:transposase
VGFGRLDRPRGSREHPQASASFDRGSRKRARAAVTPWSVPTRAIMPIRFGGADRSKVTGIGSPPGGRVIACDTACHKLIVGGEAMGNAMLDARQEDGAYRRVELITGQRRRRRWTEEEKARIVAESFEDGANISEVARRYGVARGLLTIWRRQVSKRVVKMPGFVPVRVEPVGLPRRIARRRTFSAPSRPVWRSPSPISTATKNPMKSLPSRSSSRNCVCRGRC